MPWNTVKTMDLKKQMILDWQSGQFSITDLSLKYRITRPTVYKWLHRYESEGVQGLDEQSRAPHHCPHQTHDALIELLVSEKLKNTKRGPKKIYAQLKSRYPHLNLPTPSTIGQWLQKYGLVNPRKKRLRVPPYTNPFRVCRQPNDVWSADYKGQFYTKDRKLCYPLTITDNTSRYILRCVGLIGPQYLQTRAVFDSAFREYGLPNAIRTDNGTPFATKAIGALSKLMIWFIQLGIVPERIEKGCPQQNSRHERMHRTLKDEAINPPASTLLQQQNKFDSFREDYNYNRPHESLNQKPPATYYYASKKSYVPYPREPEYDSSYTVRRVRSNGEIKFKGDHYFLTELLCGQPIGLKEVKDGLISLYYSFYHLGHLDLRKNKIIKNV